MSCDPQSLFAGAGLSTLIITTTRHRGYGQALASGGILGGLFSIETDATGQTAHRFG